jgi:Flp pilus assembly protein TadD
MPPPSTPPSVSRRRPARSSLDGRRLGDFVTSLADSQTRRAAEASWRRFSRSQVDVLL